MAISILGIDPSQRHTGLCLLRDKPIFFEIKTGSQDVLTSARTIRREFRDFILKNNAENDALCIERQLVMGGQSSSLMFHMQMNLLEAVKQLWGEPEQLMMPLPNQLQSYVYHRYGLKPTKAGGPIVQLYKDLTGDKRRISVHCADAYFLCLLGREVLNGEWSYNKPTKEPAQVPWRIIDGK